MSEDAADYQPKPPHQCPMCHGSGKVTDEEEFSFVDVIMGWFSREVDALRDGMREQLYRWLEGKTPQYKRMRKGKVR